MPVAVSIEDPVDQEGHPGGQGQHADQDAEAGEDLEGLVARVDAEDGQAVSAHIGGSRAEEPGIAGLGVGADRDLADGDIALAGLDQALERVGEVVDHQELQGGLTAVGAKSRGGIGDLGVGEASHHPAAELLEHLLGGGEVVDRGDIAVTDHHFGLAVEDRPHQQRHVGAAVLVVGVGVDDDVGAELQTGVETGLETGCQTAIVGQLDDVVDPALECHGDRFVGRSVVDHEELDLVDAVDLPGQVGKRRRQGFLLVQTGDLDDCLH